MRARYTLEFKQRQPDAVRARLAFGSDQSSQFVTRLWGTDSRGKVSFSTVAIVAVVVPNLATPYWRRPDNCAQANQGTGSD